MTTTSTTCAHEGCKCGIPPERAASNNRYCSDYCEKHAAQTGHVAHDCGCGHAPCQH